MARPDVSISAPTVLVVGQTCLIEIDVLPEKALKIEFIDATLTCDQGWQVGSGKNQVSYRLKVPNLVHRVMEEGVLDAGTTTRFTARFALPPGTPPTHAISPAWSKMRMRVHVSIPWRLDGRHDYDFVVRIPAPPHVERTPRAIRSTSATAAADKPRIELGLASTRLIIGETLVGTCAVFHLDDSDPRDVELSIVPVLALHGRGRDRERRGDATTATLTLPAGSAGTGVPFELVIPRNLPPTFSTASHEINWWLVARSGSFFSKKVEVSVPIELVDASAAATTPRLTAAPRLGDEQVAAMFAAFAARNRWRGSDPEALDDSGGQFSIETAIEAAHLHITYAYRGEAGTFLVSRVANPSLGLGLAVTPSSSLRHVFFKDVEVDISSWDRAHHVVARSAAQAIPVLRAIVPALMRAQSLGTLVRWTDDELVFELPSSMIDDSVLTGIAADLAAVSHATLAAERTVTPPPAITVDLEAWQRLSTWLHGRLTAGDLSIDGTLDAAPVSIGLTWDEDDHPTSVVVAVGDPDAASADLRSITLSLPRPARDVLGNVGAEKIVDLVTRWSTEIVDLRVVDGVASAALAVPEGAAPAIDATRVRELVEALRAVLVALDPGAGPYR